MADQYCTGCGRPWEEGIRYCPECGTAATGSGKQAPLQGAGASLSPSPGGRGPETERLRIPVTRLYEEAQREQRSLGTTVRRYVYHPAREMVITDQRVLVTDPGGRILMQMELDPGVLAEVQARAGEVRELMEVPFLGRVEVRQHIFRMRRATVGSPLAAARGCLGALFTYWFVIAALAVAASAGASLHSAVAGVLFFVAMIAALRVWPKRTVLLVPVHATPGGAGFLSLLRRYLLNLSWQCEVEVAKEFQQQAMDLLQPAAAAMQRVVQASSQWR